MGLFDRTQYSYWKSNQSYNLFWILSILGGILALDHLYLRSPLTFLAKIVVNIFAFGIWWIYDATQATFNRDVIKMYGIGIPGFGPMGIGAGSLASDKPDPKHNSFLLYSLALIFGGLFGLDSYLTGDSKTGHTRLVCLISIIFTPIAILWWLINVLKLFFKTSDVIDANWEYFGAPKPEHLKKPLSATLVEKFPFLSNVFGFFTKAKETVINLTEHPLSGAEALAKEAEAAIMSPVTKVEQIASKAKNAVVADVEAPLKEGEGILKKAASTVLGPIESVVKPILTTAESAVQPIANAVEGTEKVADDAIQLGSKAVNAAVSIGKDVTETIKAVGQLAVLPTVAGSTINSVTSNAIKAAVQQNQSQTGGAVESSSVLAYVFIGTIAVIAVSGLVRTYQRLRQKKVSQNGTPSGSKNDTPPQPGAVRRTNQEESE